MNHFWDLRPFRSLSLKRGQRSPLPGVAAPCFEGMACSIKLGFFSPQSICSPSLPGGTPWAGNSGAPLNISVAQKVGVCR